MPTLIGHRLTLTGDESEVRAAADGLRGEITDYEGFTVSGTGLQSVGRRRVSVPFSLASVIPLSDTRVAGLDRDEAMYILWGQDHDVFYPTQWNAEVLDAQRQVGFGPGAAFTQQLGGGAVVRSYRVLPLAEGASLPADVQDWALTNDGGITSATVHFRTAREPIREHIIGVLSRRHPNLVVRLDTLLGTEGSGVTIAARDGVVLEHVGHDSMSGIMPESELYV